MRKPQEDEVPQWKRDLLKRTQEKQQRMTEENQHGDILEEHLPTVSNNIFMIQEKQHGRIIPPVIHRTITPEICPTFQPVPVLSVENVIIIEKEAQDIVEEITSTNKLNFGGGSQNKDEELPAAGMVHRLMGKFQEDKFTRPVILNAASYTGTSQCSDIGPEDVSTQHCDELQQTVRRSAILPLKPQSIPAKKKLPSLTSRSTPVDLLSPLLRSSAKPFTKQSMSGGHGYHRVSIPIRKVSAATSPKHTGISQTDGSNFCIAETLASSVTDNELTLLTGSQQLVTNKVIVAQLPKPKVMSPTASFTEDLSNLHSSLQSLAPVTSRETVIIEKESCEDLTSKKQIDLEEGDTLHSSGNRTEQPDSKSSAPSTRQASLLLERNSHSFQHQTVEGGDSKNDIERVSVAAENMNLGVKADILVTEKPKGVKVTSNSRDNVLFEETGALCQKDQFKQVVHESFDESTLKNRSVQAANNIMETSKTFKIIPTKVKSERSTNSFLVQPPKPFVCWSGLQAPAGTNHSGLQQREPVLGSNRVQDESVISKVSETGKHTYTNVAKRIKIVQPAALDRLLLPSNGDILDGSETKSINSSRPLADSKLESGLEAEKHPLTPEAMAMTQLQQETQMTRTRSSFVDKTSLNTVPVTPKPESTPGNFSFGVNKATACRGKSFVIDPSKFRKSSAQQLATLNASTLVQESRNTRMVVPGARSVKVTELEPANTPSKTGRRKLSVDQITVIGGYISLKKSCLAKKTKAKKNVSLSFSEKDLETTYNYISESSLLQYNSTMDLMKPTNSPGFGKDRAIGKYTPKYLLSMKAAEILDEDEDNVIPESTRPAALNDLTPLVDDKFVAWSDTTPSSTDILF